MKKLLCTIPFICFIFFSCSREIVPINFGKDICEHCKMTIMDRKFGAEIITKKGKTYKFDSIECMLDYEKENGSDPDKSEGADFYTIDFSNPGELIKTEKAYFVKSESVKSPMSGNLASYGKQSEAAEYVSKNSGEIYDWETLFNNFENKHSGN
ncbi:MAG: nitrous oxide reductase accessory protein NosL [Bacteroidetes bacterium]|nr:nitrous oxide reductase accessory protein NosL [Bacteroidota bacterium]